MNIPRYWSKASESSELQARSPRSGESMGQFSCWGWSNISEEEARAMANERTRKVAEIVKSGKRPDSYSYGQQPMREPILKEWQHAPSAPHAAITRNAYGCEVLNTANIMFVDIDLPEPSLLASLTHKISTLFGGKSDSPRKALENRATATLQQLLDNDPQCSVRVYRTKGGLRYLFTHRLADPGNESTLAFMEALGADLLYVQLCKIQACFRARLTPKPWRCGHHSLKARFPWSSPEAQHEATRWMDEYASKSRSYATCCFLREQGPPIQHPDILEIVDVHDRISRAQEALPLA